MFPLLAEHQPQKSCWLPWLHDRTWSLMTLAWWFVEGLRAAMPAISGCQNWGVRVQAMPALHRTGSCHTSFAMLRRASRV